MCLVHTIVIHGIRRRADAVEAGEKNLPEEGGVWRRAVVHRLLEGFLKCRAMVRRTGDVTDHRRAAESAQRPPKSKIEANENKPEAGRRVSQP
jgi:hypothetical protein